ncbi:MAG TPA: nuclear transport factor 2 family protein [Terriglobales bacterium]|jgi:uncharacterized protein (TIGR02246 family)
MSADKQPTPSPGSPERDDELVYDSAVDEFFRRLKYDMRRPKPGEEGVAAALQAIQRLTVESDATHSAEAVAEGLTAKSVSCAMCGAENPGDNRFCASCGVSLQQAPTIQAPTVQEPTIPDLTIQPRAADEGAIAGPEAPSVTAPVPTPPGPHSYHHHYHHHYFSHVDGSTVPGAPERRGSAPARELAKGRPPQPGQASGRVETAVRKLAQDWALACNTKHLDDLVDLYATDALVLRSNVPPVRGTAAIREFFFNVLQAGLSDAEMESLRVELLGEVAFESGRCKTLVPVAMGKRREERGKYLLVSVRLNGEWKIIADCWSSDLSLS